MIRRSICVLAGAAAVAGCVEGTPSADLMVVERAGEVPGARVTVRIQDGGEVTCNEDREGRMTSAQLIEARALLRELRGDEEDEEPGLLQTAPDLPPAEGSIFRFRVRVEDGAVRFADNSPGRPEAYARIAKLTRDLARGPCGLER